MELDFDGDIHPGRQIEFLEFVHGLRSGLDNVEEAFVCPLFKSFLRLFITVRRALNGKALDTGRQGNGSSDTGAGAFDGVRDVAGGLIYDPMVISLKANANALSSHTKNNCLLMVVKKIPGSRRGNGLRNIAKSAADAIAFWIKMKSREEHGMNPLAIGSLRH